MSSWGFSNPNIPAAADFGLKVLHHQAVHNESIVVAPYLLAYIIIRGIPEFRNQLLAIDKIWQRGSMKDLFRALPVSQAMSPENANFTVVDVNFYKWSPGYNDSVIENPVPVEKEIEHLNDVYSRKTEGRIERLYNPTDIEDTAHITTLVSNFKATWKHKFDPSETFEGSFYTSEDSRRNLNFLSVPGAVRKFSENDHFQMLSLPYHFIRNKKQKNKRISLSMNILLPKSRFGLAAALNKTNLWAFQSLLTNTEDTYIKAIIPKFDIATPFNFERYFKSEGLEALSAKPPPKDKKTLKEEWETYYRELKYHPEVQQVYGSVITIGMDEHGSHTKNINRKLRAKSTFVHGDTHKRHLKRRKFIADHPFVFVVLYKENPMFVGTHF